MTLDKEELDELEKTSRTGEGLQEAMLNGAIDAILDEFNQKAFKIWKTIPHEDSPAIAEAQMMGKVADDIKKTIQSRIEEGKGALEVLSQITEEQNEKD